MTVKTLTNGNKRVIITRTKLADGFNYYLMPLNIGIFGTEYWNESYKQIDSITSLKQATRLAKALLSAL